MTRIFCLRDHAESDEPSSKTSDELAGKIRHRKRIAGMSQALFEHRTYPHKASEVHYKRIEPLVFVKNIPDWIKAGATIRCGPASEYAKPNLVLEVSPEMVLLRGEDGKKWAAETSLVARCWQAVET